MRLVEIEPDPAERRLSALKANAQAAKDKANDLKTQAEKSAERLELKKNRDALARPQRSATKSMITPYR